MNDFKRKDIFEKQFKKRYNRDVEVSQKLDQVDRLKISYIKIKSPKGIEYNLEEIMKDGLTIQAILKIKDKSFKYNRYLDAEIHCADLIGEE